MPNIIETLIPSFGVDRVAIFTQDYVQLFRQARAIKAVVKEEAKLMEHPVESGFITVDHRIILPVEIELSLILRSRDYQDIYRLIKQYYLNATLLVIQTKSSVYYNQLIQSMPHEEDPEQFDALIISLNLKQVQIVTSQSTVVPKDPSNQSTIDRGTQQGKDASAKDQSGLADLFDHLTGRAA